MDHRANSARSSRVDEVKPLHLRRREFGRAYTDNGEFLDLSRICFVSTKLGQAIKLALTSDETIDTYTRTESMVVKHS